MHPSVRFIQTRDNALIVRCRRAQGWYDDVTYFYHVRPTPATTNSNSPPARAAV